MKTFPHFFVSVALFLGAIGVAMAQETKVSEDTEKAVKEEIANTRKFEVGTFKANWFIGIGGGVNQYLGEHDRHMKFMNRLAPAMDIYFGKWFTPSLGFRIAYSGGEGYGATNVDDSFVNSNMVAIHPDYLKQSYFDEHPNYTGDGNDYKGLFWQKFHMWNIHADFMLNLMNLCGGYKERLTPFFVDEYCNFFVYLQVNLTSD